ncbi:uncharacterized protein Tco025E_09014 [Trypanosoma conorhini]|uniref:Uncharacterized protein n=1 Tax=Trypanosoma conorhini TaxID=83891 RepID=A0A3R7KQL4_9TRYP|nr:uncharacterized protein Tco025E_09014 [Trypanosoma conorhini]RNE99438.1 hypothetical protein Tco025E_09014 [Trypanosoma conorhini]
MSLFDDDSLSSLSSSSGGDDCGGSTHACSSAARGTGGAKGVVDLMSATGSGCVSRFTLTVEESKRAEEWRRSEAASRSQLHGSSGARAGGEGSRFHASMAEALQLRRDAREALLLRRVQKQRQEEAGNVELVEKDLEVGVFVTPQYLAALRRQRNFLVASSAGSAGSAAAGDEDGMDPVEAYVRRLEGERAAAASQSSSALPGAGSFAAGGSIDGGVEVTTHSARARSQTNAGPDVLSVEEGCASTTQDVLPSPTRRPATAAPSPDEGNVAEGGDVNFRRSLPSASAPRETVCPEDVLREARESRKRHRADRYFMAAAAERFNARALEGVGSG